MKYRRGGSIGKTNKSIFGIVFIIKGLTDKKRNNNDVRNVLWHVITLLRQIQVCLTDNIILSYRIEKNKDLTLPVFCEANRNFATS